MGLSDQELAAAVALWDDFADWRIGRTSAAWIAVTERGTYSRVIAAFDLRSMRAKLEQAAAEEAGHVR